MKKVPRQQGQVIVILAIGLIGLLAFAALAIDGGMVYSHRRQAQNAADAAAMAAALAKVKGKDWQTAAQSQAIANGFDVANDPKVIAVDVISPPEIEPFKSDPDRDQYIQVTITSEVESSFLHLVFPGVLRNTVVAVSRARPPENPAEGFALYGASLDECRAAWFSGNGKITLTGGGVFSNSDGSEKSPECESGYRGGAGTLVLKDQDIILAGYYTNSGEGGGVDLGNGKLKEFQPQQAMPTMPEVPCPSSPEQPPLNITTDTVLDPGNYSSISVRAGADLTLNSGIYCINGKFEGQGGSVAGSGVVLKMLQQEFNLGANTTTHLEAPTSGDWKGLLIYGEPAVSLIKLTGAANSYYKGTVYAPWSACEIHGTSGNTLVVDSQLICRTVKVIGDGDVEITYIPEELYKLPNTVELAK